VVDLEGNLAKIYRILLSNVKEDSLAFPSKGIVYKISLFIAKKRGHLSFFFSKKEKKFDDMKSDEQYQIFLGNQTDSIELERGNIEQASIELILLADGKTENIEKILKFVSIQNNFKLCIVSSKYDTNYFQSILGKLNIKNYRVIKKNKDKKIQILLNEIISESKNDFMLFLDSLKGTIYSDSLYHLAKSCNKDIDVIYCDEDYVNNKRTKPFFKPGWSPQLLFSFNYVGSFVLYSTSLLRSLNGFNESVKSYKYDLLLRSSKKTNKVVHIPKILFSQFEINKKKKISNDKICLENFLKKYQNNLEIITNQNYFTIKLKRDSEPLISIIIPTKNNQKVLLKCIKSIQKSTYQNYEIIIVNNGDRIESVPEKNYQIINYPKEFNFSKINNFAAKYAKGEYLLFLNDDTVVINSDWFEYMIFHATQEEVGIVGSLLLFPESSWYPTTVQHGGVTVGIGGPVIHSFSYSHYDKQSYLNLDKISRNVSAVTAACMMVRKNIFEKVGGFNEKFVVSFGDIDLCLRIKEKGYQVVYCPHARLYHAEGATRGIRHPQEDEIEFLNRWDDYIISGDEFYNTNQTHINRTFRISPHPSEIPAISLLKEIFYFRDDLKKEIPDYDKNTEDLINWAATKGVTIDIARKILIPYNKFYLNNSSEKIKKVADAIYKFNHSIELQSKFPEVLSGRYDMLISYLETK